MRGRKSKLTSAQAERIAAAWAARPTIKCLAAQYGVSYKVAWRAANRINKRAA